MPKPPLPKMRRAWGDWLVMAFGLAIALAPWVTRQTDSQAVVMNAALAGLAVMMLAELDLVHQRRWVVMGQIALGAWIVIAPFALDYAGGGALRLWHIASGLGVVLMSCLELGQSGEHRTSTDEREKRIGARTGTTDC